MLAQQVLVRLTGILTATVGVVDQPWPWTAPANRHAQGIADQLCLNAIRQRPTNDAQCVQVDHHRQVQPALVGPEVGDGRCPDLVLGAYIELAIQEILCHRQPMTAVGGEPVTALATHLNASLLHEAAGLTAPDIVPHNAQLPRHTPAAADATRALMNRLDPQHHVLPLFPTARSTPLSLVIETAGTFLVSPLSAHARWHMISGGTRNDPGKCSRNAFANLKKTCRKLGISFWDYLGDRIGQHGDIAPSPDVIRGCTSAAHAAP